jgi:hypothetical protein
MEVEAETTEAKLAAPSWKNWNASLLRTMRSG